MLRIAILYPRVSDQALTAPNFATFCSVSLIMQVHSSYALGRNRLGFTLNGRVAFHSRTSPVLNIKRFPTKKKGFENKVLGNIKSSDPPIMGDYALPLPKVPVTPWGSDGSGNCLKADSVNGVAQLSASFLSSLPAHSVSKPVAEMFDFLGRPALFLRSFCVDLIQYINTHSTLSTKDSPPSYLALNGQSLSGKSCTLLLLADYFKSTRSVVLFAPNMWRWVGGWHAYQPDAQQKDYEQPKLAASYLKFLLDFHASPQGAKSVLAELQTSAKTREKFSDCENAEALLQHGVKKEQDAELVFELFLDSLRCNKKSLPVVVAADQANCLYSTTWYADEENKFLFPHRFRFLRAWMSLLSGDIAIPNSTVIYAPSQSLRQAKAPFLDYLLSSKYEKLDGLCISYEKDSIRLNNRQRNVDYSNLTKYGVIAKESSALESPYYEHYADGTKINGISPFPSPDTKVVNVPFATKQECFSWMTWLDAAKRLNVPLEQLSLQQKWTTSGGVFGKFYQEVTRAFY